jgi:hypothetical protein
VSTGTIPFNFPPENSMAIGAILTGTSPIMNTQPLPRTTFFTAPVSGIYSINYYYHAVSSDALGTYTLTLYRLYSPALLSSDRPAANEIGNTIPLWLNRGDRLDMSVDISGMVATQYQLYVCARRVF